MKPNSSPKTVIEQWNIPGIGRFRLRYAPKYDYYFLECQRFDAYPFGHGKWDRYCSNTFETESGAAWWLLSMLDGGML